MLTFQNNNNDNNNNQKAKNNPKEEAEAKDVWRFTNNDQNSDEIPKFLTIPPATYGYCSKIGGGDTRQFNVLFVSLRSFSFLRHLSKGEHV